VEFTYLQYSFFNIFRLRLFENEKLRLIFVSKRQEIIGDWPINSVVFLYVDGFMTYNIL
jgi:hypothetical protein